MGFPPPGTQRESAKWTVCAPGAVRLRAGAGASGMFSPLVTRRSLVLHVGLILGQCALGKEDPQVTKFY